MATNIKVYGKKQTIAPIEKADRQNDSNYFELDAVYEISPSRSETDKHLVTIKDEQFVEITFTDGSTWFGDSSTLKEIFPELKAQGRSADDAPVLPFSLSTDDVSRGILNDIALKFIGIFVKKGVQKTIRSVASDIEKKPLYKINTLCSVSKDFSLSDFNGFASAGKNDTQPALLFIHGTASCTVDAFGQLKESAVWDEMVKRYGNNIIAFEHRTLTEGPLKNVSDLIDQLPPNKTYDVITHSRGGLVGELLMRFCESKDGFLPESKQLFRDEGRQKEIEWAEYASHTAQKKKIHINRFVRVACTARGTSLLSERTDIFLNTLINLIQLPGSILGPVVGGIKYLISETINSKNSFDELPGLEAQRPGSAFIKALNTYKTFDEKGNPVGFDNRLAVISGNGKFSLSLNGVKIMLTKFFFKWQQNDLVVDTVSMYQGAKRENPVEYFLDNGKDTNHFNYFLNKTTRDALMQALFAAAHPLPTFKQVQGENFDAAAGRGIFGLENGRLKPVMPKGEKPVLILLPGIMGSFLEQGDTSIWINYWRFITGGLGRLTIADDDNITATGVIKTAYSNLVEFLSGKYDVMVCPFDWRRPLADAGIELNEKIKYLRDKLKIKTTISFAAHSMGGLVVRDLMINHPDTWKQLNEQNNFRTLLLGTPWLGSYRIPHVLSGKDSIIKQLDLIDCAHNSRKLINMFSKFPGLLDLLPIHGNKDFGSKKIWEDFTKATGLDIDEIPDDLRTNFTAYTKKIKAGLGQIDFSNIVYVAGKYKETISDYTIENGSLKFFATAEGDQSVTWASGIPEGIKRDTSLYYTNASHGALSKKEPLFNGILDILEKGTTSSQEFSRVPIAVSEGSRSFESKEEFEFVSSEAGIETGILGLGEFITPDETNTPILNISISNGDLMFAKYPVMVGHFVYDDIYSAEKVVNAYLKNTLKQKHKIGLYPGPIGSSAFFKNFDEDSDFKGSIIVGLGVSELLTPYQLSITIEKAASDHLLTHCQKELKNDAGSQKKKFGLSSVLIGVGYTRMDIESACRAMMLGIINANEKVIGITGLQDLYISELEFVELLEDRSISCFISVKKLIERNNDGMNLGWHQKTIKKNPGARKRLLTDGSNIWWQRLSVLTERNSITSKPERLSFFSSTNNAREEVRKIAGDLAPIESLIADISENKQWNYEKAKALFELLVPSDFKENIKRNTDVIWVLDNYTASLPWELLHTGAKTEKPLCISSGMIRQLAISDFDSAIEVKNNNVIIIGDPNLEGLTKARQLPGAAREAQEVYDLFIAKKTKLNTGKPIINSKSSEIFTELFKHDYKIVHIAAHGFFDGINLQNTGIVVGKKKDSDEPILLTADHIKQLPATPELVFINSCFLGKINSAAEEFSASRHRLAANIGTQLIKMGVKAVVVAGWEVDDTAALAFAKKFYEEMLDGKNLGTAMLEARKHVYKNFGHTNTWGAFQCYGQPEFILNAVPGAVSLPSFDIQEQAENTLEQLISESEVPYYKADDLMEKLIKISEAVSKAGFTAGELKQLEAKAYRELNDYNTALAIYQEMLQLENASFAMSSLESYYAVKIKKAVLDFYEDEKANKITTASLQNTIDAIDEGIANIERLVDIAATAERYSLIASAYKRKARVIVAVIKDKKTTMGRKNKNTELNKALAQSALYYFSAYQHKNEKDIYSFNNWLSLKTLAGIPKGNWKENFRKDRKTVSIPMSLVKIKKQLENPADKRSTAIDIYWSLTQAIDIAFCNLYLTPGANTLKKLKDAFERTWERTGAQNKKQRQLDNIELYILFASHFGKATIASELEKLKKYLGTL